MEPGTVVAAIISGGAIVTAAIIKFAPSNNNKTCKMHSGLVSDINGIGKALEEIRNTQIRTDEKIAEILLKMPD